MTLKDRESSQKTTGPRGLVVDIDRFAVHDGPGIRTAVFLKGCPLRCIWCHSPETQSFHPELLYLPQKCTACGLCLAACEPGALSIDQANCRVSLDWGKCTHCGACTAVCYPGALKMSGAWMTAAGLVGEVEKDIPFFAASGGGVTLSGGEAAAQPGFSYQFLYGCRSLGIHTALETNGCAPWRVYRDFLEVVDLFLYDLKHMDSASHRQLTGASNLLPRRNLLRLAEQGAEVIVRVPCIPGMNDDPANIAATASFVRKAGLKRIHLLPYNPSAGAKYGWLGREYKLDDVKTQTSNKMEELAGICRSHGLAVQIGG
jgi:pyruvate formate lyase activating enzyme